ncbi:MAG: signal peptidase I [Saccharofermentans sp.]|nr:signal peptidase I [Saccharofermentans sp.]
MENNSGRVISQEEKEALEELKRKGTSQSEKIDRNVKTRSNAEELLDWLRTICIGVIVGVLIVVFVIQRDNVYGDSMMPTLNSGDVIFTQKISTYFHNYDRGDIVVLNGKDMPGYNHSEYLIKRIVGLPGETIRIADGVVYIKPKDSTEFYVLEENYLPEGLQTTVMDSGLAKGYDEITLADNEYYCLGDNRPVSNDSRTLGPFTEDRIVAVAVVRVYPFNAMRTL